MNKSILKISFTTALLLLFVVFSCKKKSTQPSSNTGSSTTRGNTTTTGGNTTGSTTTTGGTTGTTSFEHRDSLTGSIWVLYQYRDQYTTTPLPRTDTLIFIDADTYKWNGVQQAYSLQTQDNIYNKYVFMLNNTPFGTLRGLPPLTMKQYGEVINEPFSQSGVTSPQTFFLWLRKIN